MRCFLFLSVISLLMMLACSETDDSVQPDGDADVQPDGDMDEESEGSDDDFVEAEFEAEGCPAIAAPSGRITFWYEDSDLNPILDAFDELAAYPVDLTLGLHQGEVDPDSLEAAVRQMHEAGLTVNIWPLIEYGEGYFASVKTIDLFEEWYRELLELTQARCLPVSAFVFDLEPPIDTMLEMQRLFGESNGDTTAVVEFLEAQYEPAEYAEGRARMKTMIAETQQAGYRVTASTLFFLIEDPLDADDDIQKGFSVPIDDMGWDELSFQVYRSSFNDVLGSFLDPDTLLSPFVVYDYALSAIEYYGDLASFDIGIVGDERYSPAEFQQDVAAAWAAGLSSARLNVYSLQGVLRDETRPSQDWLDLSEVSSSVPESDMTVTILRSVIRSMDEQAALP